MALSRKVFADAYPNKPIDIPDSLFEIPSGSGAKGGDYPDLKTAVEWLKSFIPTDEWRRRRALAFRRLIESAYGLSSREGKGRFFDETDKFGWYLFLADSYLNHPWNYEPTFGARVIPILASIGRNLPMLQTVGGLNDRVTRLVGSEKRQPNGGFFEILVAAAYRRAGAKVDFLPERPGVAKTHDMDVFLSGRSYAIECKRLEVGEYGERERAHMRMLWNPASDGLSEREISTFGDVEFTRPAIDAPADYLVSKTAEWLKSGLDEFKWKDDISKGSLRKLNIKPLRNALVTDDILFACTLVQKILSGEYLRHASYLQAIRYKQGMSPRHMDDCDLAIMLRWKSSSTEAIGAKARDVLKRLADGNGQLPTDRPGIIHIGFEAVEGDDVERARYEKIIASTKKFDPKGKPLEYVYCHYLVPESPPDILWAFDETVQWQKISGSNRKPLDNAFLVLPNDDDTRRGVHWENQ